VASHPRPARARRLASFTGLAGLGFTGLLCVLDVRQAAAAPPTPGFPEAVVQWGVQKGETCEDIARALYGSVRYTPLLQRYNHIVCKAGAPLREGLTLVVPEKPTTLPDARLKSLNPDVRARPGGGGWTPAAPGMPLFSNYNVNTLDQGRADIEFIDRTRVVLAPNTLVVIYGTANQTRVSRTTPAAVEVDAGEVKAALSALRGDSVEVAVKGGGRVSAASRDTVVQRKGERTTVEVFDGKAGVTAGGKSVEVPKNFGTRFVGVSPPAPPRHLPPAPVWAAGGTGSTALAHGSTGVIAAAWNPVPAALAYRVELSRDADFHDLVSREEVPATITAFRGEKLPVGTYYLTVRAIDKEEYLGIAADTRTLRLIDAELESGEGTLTPGEVTANPYGVLRLAPAPETEMALDDGPFGPMPDTIDLRLRAPHELRVRRRGSTKVDVIPVHYTKVGASVEAKASATGRSLEIRAQLTGFEGVDVPVRVHPSARVHLPGGARAVALSRGPGGVFTGSLEMAGPLVGVRVDVVDDRGAVLGTSDFAPPAAPAPAPVAPGKVRFPVLGAYAPMWQISPSADVLWFAPTPLLGAAVSAGMVESQGRWTTEGQVRGSGTIGPVGLEASLRSTTTDGRTADASGWLGLRVRVLRIEGADVTRDDGPTLRSIGLEVAPSLRIGFPASETGMPAQIEPAVAVGGAVGTPAGLVTWVGDAGGRLRLQSDGSMAGVPTGQAFLLAGGTLDVRAWLRLNALLDAHLVVRDGGARNGVGGLGVGIEAGGAVYGGLSLHLAPWSDPGIGPFAGQLAIGFRGLP
jgi:hypothetical protein